MAVTKRARFEVLRRDNYTCRYCRSQANEITIDHVVPVALGGSDKPDNLVAACWGCNTGKSSATPDAALVADVADDALKWARAMEAAAQKVNAQAAKRVQFLEHFEDEWLEQTPPFAKLPDDWATTAWNFHTRGLPVSSIAHAIEVAGSARIQQWATWKYFCGVAWSMLRELEDDARQLLDSGKGN